MALILSRQCWISRVDTQLDGLRASDRRRAGNGEVDLVIVGVSECGVDEESSRLPRWKVG